jgi:integrase
MTFEEVRRGYSLELRERLVFKLATVGGMRPGEIFGLRRGSVFAKVIDIHERLYRGKMNTPKSQKSERKVPPAPTLLEDIDCWLLQCPDRGPDSWLFPSERLTTPLSKDNFMSRWMRPALKNIGLGRVNFQIMRRTHACLMKALKEDPKVVADLMGHNVNVHLNVYTQSSMEARQQAVNNLEFAIIN